MMKNNIILFIMLSSLLCFPFTEVKTQNEVTVLILKKGKSMSSEFLNSHSMSDSTLSTSTLHLDSYRFNPLLNPYYSLVKSNPISLNYNMSESYKFSERLYITPYNRQAIYLGLGNYENIGASLKWTPLSKLSIEGGSFVSLQYGYLLFSQHRTIGFNFNLDYDISKKLQWSMYGQYMRSATEDPFLNKSNEFPKTNMGAALRYKAKKNSQIGIGVGYQYNQQNKKWKPEAKGKVSLGF